MLETQLHNLGFHKNEIKVYLALFELGKCKASDIIDHTKLHRNLVYTALEALEQKRIISKLSKGKVAIFEANSPEVILEAIEEKKNLAAEVVKKLKAKQIEAPRDINVYDGIEGIKLTREKVTEQIKPGETYYILGISDDQENKKLDPFFAANNTKIVNKGANIKALYDQSSSQDLLINRKLAPITQARKLPFGAKNPMWVTFFQDQLNMSVVGVNPVTFSIRSKEAVEGFINYFEYFWNQKVSVETGVAALEKTAYAMLDELAPGEEYLVLGASAGDNVSEVQKLYDRFHADRIKKGVITKMLVYRESFDRIKKRYNECGDPEGKISLVKTYTTAPATPMQINLFHNKAFIILYGDEPTVIHFEQKEIHDGFKKYFEELWNQETQILKGAEALRELWLEAVDCGELRWIGAKGYFIARHPEIYEEIKAKAARTPGVVWKNIVSADFKGHLLTKLPWMQTKYNLDKIRNPNAIWLFGNKVLVVNWAEDIPVIFQSTNKQMVQSYNDYFEELWGKK